jgi:hypothetical protein
LKQGLGLHELAGEAMDLFARRKQKLMAPDEFVLAQGPDGLEVAGLLPQLLHEGQIGGGRKFRGRRLDNRKNRLLPVRERVINRKFSLPPIEVL